MGYSKRTIAIEVVGGVATVVFALASMFVILSWASIFISGGNALGALVLTALSIPIMAPYLWLRFRSEAWPGPYTQRIIDAVS